MLINDGEPFLYRDHPDAGMSRAQFRAAVREGALRNIIDGVYGDPRVQDTLELRVAAARLIVPSHAVVCGDSASWVFGVDTRKPGDRHKLQPSWVVPHGSSRTRVKHVGCRQAVIGRRDVVHIDGLSVTTPLRTTSDFLRKKWRPYAIAAADAMAHFGLVTVEEVEEQLATLKGFPGIRQARSLGNLIEPLAASQGESWTRLRLTDAGLPRPTAQHSLIDAAGNQRYVDLAYVAQMLAMEYDGRLFHTADTHIEHDGRRRHLLEAAGQRFVIARREDIFGEDPRFEHEVGKLIGRDPLPRFW